LYTHTGAGAYECGEESALLESLEGKRGIPRIRPPFPAVSGAFQCPTILNNVETYCAVPAIIRDGGAAFAALGIPKAGGTKLTCLTGHVNRPGVYELKLGFPVKTMIEEVGGGILGGKRLKAFIPGGSSCPVLTAAECEGLTMDYDAMAKAKTHAGIGRRGDHARRYLHGESGAAHHAVLCARKLWVVHSVPRGHLLDSQAAAALSRWHGAAQRYRADRRSGEEHAGQNLLPVGRCGGAADHLDRREVLSRV
jgi:hypothetical protein